MNKGLHWLKIFVVDTESCRQENENIEFKGQVIVKTRNNLLLTSNNNF